MQTTPAIARGTTVLIPRRRSLARVAITAASTTAREFGLREGGHAVYGGLVVAELLYQTLQIFAWHVPRARRGVYLLPLSQHLRHAPLRCCVRPQGQQRRSRPPSAPGAPLRSSCPDTGAVQGQDIT